MTQPRRPDSPARSQPSPDPALERAADGAAPEPSQDDGPYLRLPWPLVAGALLLVLLAAGAVGLVATNARPSAPAAAVSSPTSMTLARPAVAPTQAAPPVARPTAAAATAVTPGAVATTPGAVATASRTQTAAAPMQQPTPPATSQPAATSPPTPAAAPATTPLATAEATPSPRPTVDPALAQEVSAAYEHYWQVRAQAFFDLDASRLSEVMAGEHLADAERLISDLRDEGHAIRTSVRHNFGVVSATAMVAQIADKYADESVYVDPETHADTTQPLGETVEELYDLNKIDGTWRVVRLGRYVGT